MRQTYKVGEKMLVTVAAIAGRGQTTRVRRRVCTS